ncbi:MAG: hypothetical protein ACKO3V_10660 [Pirellula sp.]
MKKSIIYLPGFLLLSVLMYPKVGSADVSPQQLEPFRKVQAGDDAGVAQASKLAKELSARDDLGSLTALRAMKGATSLGKNWLLGLANAAQNRKPASKNELEAFLTNMSEDAEARYTVFRWLTDGNAEVRKQWLGKMTDDPSPEIRYEAIALALEP